MLRQRYDPHPAKLTFKQNNFKHVFGGAPRHKGATPEGHEAPMHLLLDLDLSDQLVPIEGTSDLNRLPIYYPLVYGGGGGEVQYRVDSDSEITILSSFIDEEPDEYPETSFPKGFPEKRVSIDPLSYEQYRAIIMSEHGSNHYKNDRNQKQDHKLLGKMNSGQIVRFGHPDSFSPIQGDILWGCMNQDCEYYKRSVKVDIFAQFADKLTDEISIWSEPGESSSFVEIYFGLIQCCKTIVTENQCT